MKQNVIICLFFSDLHLNLKQRQVLPYHLQCFDNKFNVRTRFQTNWATKDWEHSWLAGAPRFIKDTGLRTSSGNCCQYAQFVCKRSNSALCSLLYHAVIYKSGLTEESAVCFFFFLKQTRVRRYVNAHTGLDRESCAEHEPTHTPRWFSLSHQTKHCNLSPSLSRADLRPLKVSRSVCGGQKCQSCGFQRRVERLRCGGRLLCYICCVSVRGVLFF